MRDEKKKLKCINKDRVWKKLENYIIESNEKNTLHKINPYLPYSHQFLK